MTPLGEPFTVSSFSSSAVVTPLQPILLMAHQSVGGGRGWGCLFAPELHMFFEVSAVGRTGCCNIVRGEGEIIIFKLCNTPLRLRSKASDPNRQMGVGVGGAFSLYAIHTPGNIDMTSVQS